MPDPEIAPLFATGSYDEFVAIDQIDECGAFVEKLIDWAKTAG